MGLTCKPPTYNLSPNDERAQGHSPHCMRRRWHHRHPRSHTKHPTPSPTSRHECGQGKDEAPADRHCHHRCTLVHRLANTSPLCPGAPHDKSTHKADKGHHTRQHSRHDHCHTPATCPHRRHCAKPVCAVAPTPTPTSTSTHHASGKGTSDRRPR